MKTKNRTLILIILAGMLLALDGLWYTAKTWHGFTGRRSYQHQVQEPLNKQIVPRVVRPDQAAIDREHSLVEQELRDHMERQEMIRPNMHDLMYRQGGMPG